MHAGGGRLMRDVSAVGWKGKALLPAILVGLLLSAPACAGEPVAVVEEVRAVTAGVQFMDYLEDGQRIVLGPGESVILGYLGSCWRERITGGTVTVGREQSVVVGGEVRRQRVDCDGGTLDLADSEADKSGVLVLRAPEDQSAGELPKPDLILFGSAPVISLASPGGMVTFTRLDQAAAPIEVPVGGLHQDLADTRMRLVAGGLYRVEAGERMLIVKIDPYARPGAGPILGRLLRI